MSTNIYVGNLAFSTKSSDLEALFAEHGEVTDAHVITDRDTGRSHADSGSSKWLLPMTPRRLSVRSTVATSTAAISR